MARRAIGSAFVICSLALCGCSKPSQPAGGVSPRAPSTDAADWTREGLEVQQRMSELRERTPRDSGLMPGTTPWHVAAEPAAESLRAQTADTPGGLLAAVSKSQGWAALLGDAVWEQTMRVWTDGADEAVGVILLWGYMDDAIAGRDFRVGMRRSSGRWAVERVEERYHCSRKVTPEGRCG